jgi:hypothetical protein
MLPLPPATLPTMFMALSKVGEYLMTLRVSSQEETGDKGDSLVLQDADDTVVCTVCWMVSSLSYQHVSTHSLAT